ncbi:MAG: TVP38/TMEM64 family protein [Candidatus Undinarchaeales archaeon]|jgi:uncharacterized membrane protein YdjX (TVP38/TMEM64 family)|nr:TVP38/TMEM64 family protein [Candidatus Undinarchaeales archaeon]MDP7491325.1 TVP38/TMEM64 family protein [Candidatus Undinarchaeales archaeon]
MDDVEDPRVSWKDRPSAKIGLVVLFFVLVLIALLALDVDYTALDPRIIKEIFLSFGPLAPVAYITFYTVRSLVLFPSGMLTMIGGLTFGPLWGTVYSVIGGGLNALVSFLIARLAGREAVESYISGSFADLDERIERNGFLTVLMIRLVPNAPYDVQNYGLGLTAVSFRDYTLATFIGIIPGAFAFVYLGHSISDLSSITNILIAVMIIMVLFLVQKRMRWQQQDEDIDGGTSP